jgi:hypothetical protein
LCKTLKMNLKRFAKEDLPKEMLAEYLIQSRTSPNACNTDKTNVFYFLINSTKEGDDKSFRLKINQKGFMLKIFHCRIKSKRSRKFFMQFLFKK